MADDISKNISIQITAETDKLEQSIGNLNTIITDLLEKQKQLANSGQINSDAFKNSADKIEIYNKRLQNVSTQLNGFKTALDSATGSLQQNKTLISALTTAKEKYSITLGDNSTKVKELNSAIQALSASAKNQQAQTIRCSAATDKHGQSLTNSAKQVKSAGSSINTASNALSMQASAAIRSKGAVDDHTKTMGAAVTQAKKVKTGLGAVNSTLTKQNSIVEKSRSAFDLHKATMDHLKESFDEIKDISGEFGPSLQDVAQGFNIMKSGLDVMKDGIEGIGTAIKADGFDFLLQIVQYLFDAFVHSSEGGKMLQGAISAIGVIVNDVRNFVSALTDIFIKAFSHPIDTIKELGRIIMQNLINRFTALSVILDGIMHLDFKKVTNGAIQAVTGITNATDKISTALKTAKDGMTKTVGEMVNAYNSGTKNAGQAINTHEQNVKQSVERQKGYYKDLGDYVAGAYSEEEKNSNGHRHHSKNERRPQIEMVGTSTIPADSTNNLPAPDLSQLNLKNSNGTGTTDQAVTNLKTKFSQVMNDIKSQIKESWQTIATEGIGILGKSIQQQSAAKIAALQKDEAAELNNASLTSTQKLAIQQKYQQQINQIKAKAFKEEQELNIAKILMNAAVAEVKLWDDPGFPGAIAMTVALAAQTAAQIAQIASQKPPAYAAGGLHYRSDGRGGMLPGYSRTDNTNAFLRSGEGIVVSEAMREPWARNLVSAINVGFGGRDFSTTATGKGFAVGGIFTDGGNANRYYNQPVNDNKNLANTIAYQMINNFPPVYVDVKDINNQQNILAQTINRVNL
ncbi:MAG: hypothetical protein ACTHNW_18780 [Mucilaginibacter sp.]